MTDTLYHSVGNILRPQISIFLGGWATPGPDSGCNACQSRPMTFGPHLAYTTAIIAQDRLSSWPLCQQHLPVAPNEPQVPKVVQIKPRCVCCLEYVKVCCHFFPRFSFYKLQLSLLLLMIESFQEGDCNPTVLFLKRKCSHSTLNPDPIEILKLT